MLSLTFALYILVAAIFAIPVAIVDAILRREGETSRTWVLVAVCLFWPASLVAMVTQGMRAEGE